MRRILLFTFLIFALTSCNSLKRLDRLAIKYGQEITDTITLDTIIRVPGVSFNASYFKKYTIKDLNGLRDTIQINLQDGTKIVLVDQYAAEKAFPEQISVKRQAFVIREEQEIHLVKRKNYKRIVVNPPDKMDVLLANLKWISLSIFSILMIVWFVRKLIL